MKDALAIDEPLEYARLYFEENMRQREQETDKRCPAQGETKGS